MRTFGFFESHVCHVDDAIVVVIIVVVDVVVVVVATSAALLLLLSLSTLPKRSSLSWFELELVCWCYYCRCCCLFHCGWHC